MPERPAIRRLREALAELEIPSSTLRRDPSGDSWLPPELKALVERDPECREELRRFVIREIELFGSVRERPEAAFTARVLQAARPVEIAGAGLDPRVRSWILGLAYAVATVVGYLTVAPLLGLAGREGWLAGLHERLGLPTEGPGPWGLALLGAAIVAALALALVPVRRGGSRTPSAPLPPQEG